MTTTNSNPHNNWRPPGGGRPGPSVPDVAGELRRLMPRDRWLIDLLHQHQVLSTEQIAALAFDNVHTARNRLNQFGRRGVLARFRDCVRPGWTPGGRSGNAATSPGIWPTRTGTACGPKTVTRCPGGWSGTTPASPPGGCWRSWTGTWRCTAPRTWATRC